MAELLTEPDAHFKQLHPDVIHVLGGAWSFSDIMAHVLFGRRELRRKGRALTQIIPEPNFDVIAEKLQRKEAPTALFPLENSSTSPVSNVVDILLGGEVSLHGEAWLEIHLHLAAKERAKRYKQIISHHKALKQAKQWLKLNGYHSDDLVEVESTTVAADIVAASDEPVAAICSKMAAEHTDGLTIFETDIEDDKDNKTRFVLAGSYRYYQPANLSVLKQNARGLWKVTGLLDPYDSAMHNGYHRALDPLVQAGIAEETAGKQYFEGRYDGDRRHYIELIAEPRRLFEGVNSREFAKIADFTPLGVFPVASVYREPF